MKVKKERRRKPAAKAGAVPQKSSPRQNGWTREARERLISSEKLASLGRLTAGACHEILNPLSIISMQAQLALTSPDLEHPLKERFQGILEQVQRIVNITDQLRRFSRKESIIQTSMPVDEVIEETLSLLGRELQLANVRLQKELAQGLPEIQADRRRLSQVFLNLISNAKDAMPQGGSLTVSARVKGVNGRKTVEVSFSDTGHGISRENLLRLFEPFFTTKPQDQGTGLGLSICREIVENYDGKISAESAEGKGSTFRVELPALVEGERL